MRVVVLGAGFGGLELTTKLSEEFGDTADVVALQVPPCAQRGRAAPPRLPHGAGSTRHLGDRARDAPADADPALARPLGGSARRLCRTRHLLHPQPRPEERRPDPPGRTV